MSLLADLTANKLLQKHDTLDGKAAIASVRRIFIVDRQTAKKLINELEVQGALEQKEKKGTGLTNFVIKKKTW